MKKIVLLFSISAIFITSTMYGQELNAGFTVTEEWRRPRDSIARLSADPMTIERQRWASGYYHNLNNIPKNRYNFNFNVQGNNSGDCTVYRSGGIQYVVEPERTSSHSNYYAQQKLKNAQRDAARAAFNEERRRRMEEAARIAAIKKQMEDARKRKLYKENYIAATQADIDKTNAIADAKATIGRQAVLDRTSELWSQRYYKQEYVPVSPEQKSPVDLSSIVSSDFKDRKVIPLLSVGASNYYDYQNNIDLIIRNAAQRHLKHVPHDGNDKNSYDVYETDDVKEQSLPQYMYSKYITENIMNVEDWWYRNNMSERVEKVKNFLGEAVTDPLGTVKNVRESTKEFLKENITLENIAKYSVPDRYENVYNTGEATIKIVWNTLGEKDGAKRTFDAVYYSDMQYVKEKEEYIVQQVNNLELKTVGIENGDKITEAALLHNKPKTEQNEWLKNYLTNKATEPSNYVKREATGKIKEIVKKEIDPKGTIF